MKKASLYYTLANDWHPDYFTLHIVHNASSMSKCRCLSWLSTASVDDIIDLHRYVLYDYFLQVIIYNELFDKRYLISSHGLCNISWIDARDITTSIFCEFRREIWHVSNKSNIGAAQSCKHTHYKTLLLRIPSVKLFNI